MYGSNHLSLNYYFLIAHISVRKLKLGLCVCVGWGWGMGGGHCNKRRTLALLADQNKCGWTVNPVQI